MISEIRQERNWVKKCELILIFHNEECDKYDRTRNDKWTMEDTSKILGYSIGYVSESLKLAKALKANSVIGKLTRETALKVLKNK